MIFILRVKNIQGVWRPGAVGEHHTNCSALARAGFESWGITGRGSRASSLAKPFPRQGGRSWIQLRG